jgi:ERCC4-type nuclease
MDNEHLPPIRLKYVDSREPDSIRSKMLEYGWNQSALTNGDFSFQAYDYKWIGVTRKTVSDLIGSIGDRFAYQLENMLDAYQVNIIMIEGSWKQLSPDAVTKFNGELSNMTWDSIWNWLHRFLVKGFVLELTTSEQHTIHRLNALFALYQKEYSVSAKSKDYIDDRVMAFPSGCRGKTAMSLLKGRSLKEVCSMSEDWYKEHGLKVGDKKASTLWTHFNCIKD